MAETVQPDQRVRVGKVPFEVSTMEQAVNRVITAAKNSEPVAVRLSNAYCVALAAKDPEYAALLSGQGINFPDGAPVVWFMRRAVRGAAAKRVRGPSLFRELLNPQTSDNAKHFFLGTNADTLTKLTTRLRRIHPEISISGTYSPPFSDLDDTYLRNCADAVLATDAQIVWVALGTPKQDFLADSLSGIVGRPCVGVGAAFDFAAGTVNEAPRWVQSAGLEWLYRLATEPRRLWRRYLIGNVQFIITALRDPSN